MIVLAVNCGSSSLKVQLVDATAAGERRLASGLIERIGGTATITARAADGPGQRETREVGDHDEAVRLMLTRLSALSMPEPYAVGHRIVHGGARLIEPTRIDDHVLGQLTDLQELAPLHNAPGVAGIQACRRHLGAVPMVAVFDTGFHATLPDVARQYAIPAELAERHGIRRFGFHGISCAFIVTRYAELTGRATESMNMIVLHLGNGCSATAIREGRSIDTSMGLTPLEGLVMGTRSGDLDPAIVGVLAARGALTVAEVERALNERSGLLGLSGISRDMRDLLAREETDSRARRAVDLFCYRARKYVGAYLAALGGADALVFTGGIGEHAPPVRARICNGLEGLGVVLDDERNAAAVPDARIGSPRSRVDMWVIATDEERMIARETRRCLGDAGG